MDVERGRRRSSKNWRLETAVMMWQMLMVSQMRERSRPRSRSDLEIGARQLVLGEDGQLERERRIQGSRVGDNNAITGTSSLRLRNLEYLRKFNVCHLP